MFKKKSRDTSQGTSYKNYEYLSLPSCVTEAIDLWVVSPVIGEVQGVEKGGNRILHDPSNLHLLEKDFLLFLNEAGLDIDLGERVR